MEGGSSKKYIYLGNYPEGQERECGGLWTLEKKNGQWSESQPWVLSFVWQVLECDRRKILKENLRNKKLI